MLAALLCATAICSFTAEEGAGPGWNHALGIEVNLDELAKLPREIEAAEVEGQGLVISSALDLEGLYAQDRALESLERILTPLVDLGLRPALTLSFYGRSLPRPQEVERMEAWESALQALSRLSARGVGAIALELPDDLESAGVSLEEAAFFVKRSGVALRTSRRELPVLLVLPDPLEKWLEPLLSEDVGPYVDGVILHVPAGEGSSWVGRRVDALLELWPGLLFFTRGWEADSPEAVVETYLSSVQEGASAVLLDRRGMERDVDVWRVLARLRQEIPDNMPPAPRATVRFVTPEGNEVPAVHGQFFDSEKYDAVLWYRSREAVDAQTVEVSIGTADAVSPSVLDPLSGEEEWVDLWIPSYRKRTTRFDVSLKSRILLLRYHRDIGRAGGLDDLEVASERIPPVAEILAQHQAFQAAQDRRLQRWIADATIGLHYSIGTVGNLFDLTYESTLYADPGGVTDWEHRRLLFNGTPYRARKLPDLPYVLPERVVQVPLRLTLDKDYRYRLVKRTRVRGRPAWEVEFEPVEGSQNLYRGRVWIDTRSFARLRLTAVQTRVESPVLSLEETLHFEPLGAGENPLWVLKRSRGQQLITVSGRNLILVREIEFDNYRINPADFDEQRESALASENFIVRETETGYETLELQKDGTRVARPSGSRRTLLLLGGIFYNQAVDTPVPLAGINYFNFKTGGRDLQLELFIAGAFNFVNLTDPSFRGSKWEIGSDLITRAIPLTDRYIDTGLEGEEVEAFGVDDIAQSLSFFAARPFGSFFKLTGTYELDYIRYSRDEDTSSSFVTPTDTFVHNIEGRMDFNRRGTTVRLFARYSQRSDWEPWGFPGSLLTPPQLASGFGEGSLLEEFDPDNEDYLRYGVNVSSLWNPTLLQTLRAELSWLQGEDLDRFSKYTFGTLGTTRLRGFGGSGIRFDQGFIGRGVYMFGLGSLMRLDTSIEYARVRERDLGKAEFLNFTGLGLAGNFTLPGGWMVRLDYGIGLVSDLDELEGDQEILLQFLRIY